MGNVTEAMSQMNAEYAKSYYKNFIGVDNDKIAAQGGAKPQPSSSASQRSAAPSQRTAGAPSASASAS